MFQPKARHCLEGFNPLPSGTPEGRPSGAGHPPAGQELSGGPLFPAFQEAVTLKLLKTKYFFLQSPSQAPQEAK